LEVSNISDKSLGDISLEDKSKWREFTTPDDFFGFTRWDREFSATLMAEFGQGGEPLHEAILESAIQDPEKHSWMADSR
jgi:hypothetical protein